MNLSDRTKLFPERPEFAAWRKSLDVRKVVGECTRWDKENGCLVKTDAKKLEHLYEFLAAQGRLAEFDAAWSEIEKGSK